MFSVALTSYRVVVDEEQVMLGNEILLKCDIPSFVADFVVVDGWVDSEGLGIADDGNYQGNQVFLYTQTYPCKMSHKRAVQCRALIIGLAPACCALLSLQRSQSKLKEGTDNAYCPWFPQKITSSNLFQPVFSFSVAREIASWRRPLPSEQELFVTNALFGRVYIGYLKIYSHFISNEFEEMRACR